MSSDREVASADTEVTYHNADENTGDSDKQTIQLQTSDFYFGSTLGEGGIQFLNTIN